MNNEMSSDEWQNSEGSEILAWVNKHMFVCLSRFMYAHTPFHKPSHKKVSEVFFGRPLSTFYGGVCLEEGSSP